MKYLMEGITTERIEFRLIKHSDFDEWINFFRDSASFEHWKTERLKPEDECKVWYEKQFGRYTNNKGGMNALLEKTSGKLIGHSGLLVQTVDGVTELEIAYSLLPHFRRQGFATEAARACRDFAFTQNLAQSLISIISITNLASAQVAQKIGMQAEKQTLYNNNSVDIFRIHKKDWLENIYSYKSA